MIKRALCFMLCAAVALTIGGCWNYRGLNEMSLVLGLAIDVDEKTGNYLVTYEVFQPSGSSDTDAKQSQLIESEGKTIFDAARNAKRRLLDKLYFGSASILIISQKIAEQGNLLKVMGWFLSDAECRETLCLIISQTHKASEILKARGEGNEIVSNILHDIITEDSKSTSSLPHTQLYQAYNTLKAQGVALTLPAVHTTLNDDKMIPELNGSAVFHGEKLIGFLTPEESKYYLLALNKVQGGILTVSPSGEAQDNLALEISSNTGEITFSVEQGEPVFHVNTVTKVFVGEKGENNEKYEKEDIQKIEAAANEMVKSNIEKVIQKSQKEYNADIFGLGNEIYKHDLGLWKKIGERWDELFPSIKVEVTAKVSVVNTAFIK